MAQAPKEPNLINPEDMDEYLRIDSSFRIVMAAYCTMLDRVAESNGNKSTRLAVSRMTDIQKKTIMNLLADARYKAKLLMGISPNLRRLAVKHIKKLQNEIE